MVLYTVANPSEVLAEANCYADITTMTLAESLTLLRNSSTIEVCGDGCDSLVPLLRQEGKQVIARVSQVGPGDTLVCVYSDQLVTVIHVMQIKQRRITDLQNYYHYIR